MPPTNLGTRRDGEVSRVELPYAKKRAWTKCLASMADYPFSLLVIMLVLSSYHLLSSKRTSSILSRPNLQRPSKAQSWADVRAGLQLNLFHISPPNQTTKKS